MKELILSAAKTANISAVGVCRARIWHELDEILDEKTPMVTNNKQVRLNPFLHLPNAKSVIVCLFSYKNSSKKSGNVSLYARGLDYHKVISEKLDLLKEILVSNGYEAKVFCDNTDLCDRYLAYMAGLGFFGKNRLLINEKYGSYTFIGSILTDAVLEPDEPISVACKNCGKCISACPGGALSSNGYDPLRCVSYLTQTKGELSTAEINAVKKSGFVWGCDLCQSVCPYNEYATDTDIPEFKYNLIDTLDINMADSNKQFKKKYSDRAFSWRGFNIIKRNLNIFKED